MISPNKNCRLSRDHGEVRKLYLKSFYLKLILGIYFYFLLSNGYEQVSSLNLLTH